MCNNSRIAEQQLDRDSNLCKKEARKNYPIPSNIMCVYYLFFSPKICEKLRILIECEH